MKMKHPVAASLGMAICLLSGVLVGRSSRAVAQTEPSATQSSIQQLFRDRYDVADRGYTLSMIGHQPGQALGSETMNWLRLRANARRGLPTSAPGSGGVRRTAQAAKPGGHRHRLIRPLRTHRSANLVDPGGTGLIAIRTETVLASRERKGRKGAKESRALEVRSVCHSLAP